MKTLIATKETDRNMDRCTEKFQLNCNICLHMLQPHSISPSLPPSLPPSPLFLVLSSLCVCDPPPLFYCSLFLFSSCLHAEPERERASERASERERERERERAVMLVGRKETSLPPPLPHTPCSNVSCARSADVSLSMSATCTRRVHLI